jgi:hypothetical protein
MQMLRRAMPFVYVIAILLAVLLGSGRLVGGVAAIGGVLLAGFYAVTGGSRSR